MTSSIARSTMPTTLKRRVWQPASRGPPMQQCWERQKIPNTKQQRVRSRRRSEQRRNTANWITNDKLRHVQELRCNDWQKQYVCKQKCKTEMREIKGNVQKVRWIQKANMEQQRGRRAEPQFVLQKGPRKGANANWLYSSMKSLHRESRSM